MHIDNQKKPYEKASDCIIPTIGHSEKASVNTEDSEKTRS